MILFKVIRYKNILSSGNAFTEMLLDSHKTTLIVGENGAGKSTILDALSFGLYGKPFRKINKNQLINSINGKGALVEVEFLIGKKHYKVVRGIKPNTLEIYVDGNLLNQNADVKEYQEAFENQILKLNHKAFNQIVILGNASFVPFMQLPSAHRRELIENLLDLQIFSTMNLLLKDKVSINKSKLTEVEFALQSTADKVEITKKHIKALQQNNDELIKERQDKIQELNTSIEKANADINIIVVDIQSLQDQVSDQPTVQKNINKAMDILRQLDSKVSKLQSEIDFFSASDECPTCRQGIETDHKHEIVEKDTGKIKEIEDGKAQLQKELDELQTRLNQITDTNNQIAEKNKDVSSLNVQVRTWTNFVSDVNKEIEKLQSSNGQIESNLEEINKLKQQLKDALSSKDELLKDKQVHDIATTLLKDSGIKTKIVKQYIPIINKLINKYLAAMDFFVNFELNENFEETIKSRFRDEFTYDSFSEGEKMRIDLALLFAWRTIAKLRNSASTNLLIMDEVFDSSLDGSGTDEFLKILNGLTADTNTFIISHKGDQLFDKFEHVVKFEKHKNFSRVVS
jgi:DNA repair exonuclease SbcCD ATPase subunit